MPFDSNYTVNKAIYEVISTVVDTLELRTMKELFLVAVSGLLLRLVYSAVELRSCLLFVYCEKTNEPNEPLDAWWSVQVALHSISEFKPNFEFASIEVKLSKMTDFYLE